MKQDYQHNKVQMGINKEFIKKCQGIFSDCNSSKDVQLKFSISKGAVLTTIKKSEYNEEKFAKLIENKSKYIKMYTSNKYKYKNNVEYIFKIFKKYYFSEEEERKMFSFIQNSKYKFATKASIRKYINHKYKMKRNRIILKELAALSNQNYDSLRRNIYNNFGPEIFSEDKGLSKENIERIIKYINTRVIRRPKDRESCSGKAKKFSILPYRSFVDICDKNNVSREFVGKIYKNSNSPEEFFIQLNRKLDKLKQFRKHQYELNKVIQDICNKYYIDYTKIGELSIQYFMNINKLNIQKFFDTDLNDNINKLEEYLHRYAKKNNIFTV